MYCYLNKEITSPLKVMALYHASYSRSALFSMVLIGDCIWKNIQLKNYIIKLVQAKHTTLHTVKEIFLATNPS